MTVTLTIKKVPVALARDLRRRAAAHHRSLQGELLRLLEAAAAEPLPAVRESAAPFQVLKPTSATKRGTTPEGRLTLAQAWERSRRIMAAASTPATSGESADIVRRDRDTRETRRRG
jgi:plasmid stability protein